MRTNDGEAAFPIPSHAILFAVCDGCHSVDIVYKMAKNKYKFVIINNTMERSTLIYFERNKNHESNTENSRGQNAEKH